MKRESKFSAKNGKTGPPLPKYGHRTGQLSVPWNAPADSWWTHANGHFYEQARAELPRMLQSRIHHQIVAVRIVGHLGSE